MRTKNIIFIALLSLLVGFSSCMKDHEIPMGKTFAPDVDETFFIGDWGVERIEYYNIDYQGNPIAASLNVFTCDPNDVDNGIQMVFREDNSGELRNYSTDTISINHFSYFFDKDNYALYINIEERQTFMLKISNLSYNTFIYENEYAINTIEKAYLIRISNNPSKFANGMMTKHSYKLGPILTGGVN